MKVVVADRKHRDMDLDGIRDLLNRAMVGRLCTIGPDARPYVVPLHFVFEGDCIFVHAAKEGMKLDNIRSNPAVCFEVDEMIGLGINAEKACASTTYYKSAIAMGKASVIEDMEKKRRVLMLLMEKHSDGRPVGNMPDAAIAKTCVIEIAVEEISGKAHLPEGW